MNDMQQRTMNAAYTGSFNSRVAFPLGGLGSGMFCLEGTGAFSHFSLRSTPDLRNEPLMFSALSVKHKGGLSAKVLEGPVPSWKVFVRGGTGTGSEGKHYGLARFAESTFEGRFPFGKVELHDPKIPVEVIVTGWSPFIPLHADDSSLPAAGLEYTFVNTSEESIELVYSYHTAHIMAAASEKGMLNIPREGSHTVRRTTNGFILEQPPADDKPWVQGAFSAATDQPQTIVDCAWFRGGWFDSMSMVWNAVAAGRYVEKPPVGDNKPSPGASLYVPLNLQPGERKTVRLRLSWYVPETNLQEGVPKEPVDQRAIPEYHKPWYAGRFAAIDEVADYWEREYDRLRKGSADFRDCFDSTTLPAEIKEAVAANLSILKSPTILRQTDGRLWGWEGCLDLGGCCHGSCTHVYNYAQSIPILFPELERGFRQTEFHEGQDERGHQNFRIPLPIQSADHGFHAASDGQLGGIMKLYREWRISGDTEWLKRLWPKAKDSLSYCINTWDPDGLGILIEPHHNTYDIEFWGPDGMCTSIYLGALKAASLIARALGESSVKYDQLYSDGRHYLEHELYNGEYFEQKMIWEGLRHPSPVTLQNWNIDYSPEAVELLQQQGPKYQYGKGCLADGIIGAWMAEMCGLGEILDRDKVRSHLLSVYRYNMRHDLSEHSNPQRPGYALGNEGGLLLCTWPKGGELALPFVYSNEVWTGIEYQVASHLLSLGCVEEGLDIVRTCRSRYDGRVRNPFNEYECGQWYARAMASFGLIQGWSGIRYDACDRTLYFAPKVEGDYRSFLCTAEGYGVAGIQNGAPFFEMMSGHVRIDHVRLVK
ncbi:GH116 family glycosyl hydrolase [Paenibacillus sp. GCM10023250]|uniref:GH116 family glycosyl hydrolase n=1 Tax=Paenibacillus sp. GCM10023250 TaxID=3252648 RepID=UPI00361A6109